MKKMCTIFTTLLLVCCSTTWTMLIQTERSPQALAYRKQLPKSAQAVSYRSQLLQKQQQLLQALAENSITIQSQLKDLSETDTKPIFEHLINQGVTTKKTLNSLAQLHANPSISLTNKSVEELVQMMNLATFLDMQKPKKDEINPLSILQNALLTKIKNEKLSELQTLKNLDPNKVAELTHDFIKQQRIAVQLVRPYQEKLPSELIEPLRQIAPKNYFPKLLSFDNDKLIYSFKSNDLRIYKQLIIKNRSTKEEKSFFEDLVNPITITDIFTSPANSFCILQYLNIDQDYESYIDYKLFNFTNYETSNLPLLRDTTWCFASDDAVCFIDKNKEVIMLNPTTNATQNIVRLDLNTNESCSIIIGKIIKDKPLLAISTNQNRIFIINDKKQEIIQAEESAQITNLKLNNNGTTLFYETVKSINNKILSININDPNEPARLICSLDQNGWYDIINTSNDHILIAKYLSHIKKSHDDYQRDIYVFILPDSPNYWQKPLHKKKISCFSRDGSQSAEETYDTFHTATNIVTLYDDNMTEALNYLDTTKPVENYDYNQRLLGTILLFNILEKQNTKQLDETELKIYENDIPQKIKNILATIQTQQEQPAQTSLRNKILYGTAAIGAAIGATAAYKWWTGNKE